VTGLVQTLDCRLRRIFTGQFSSPHPPRDGQNPFDKPHWACWLVATAPFTTSAPQIRPILSGFGSFPIFQSHVGDSKSK
jgi:hypothetical protein